MVSRGRVHSDMSCTRNSGRAMGGRMRACSGSRELAGGYSSKPGEEGGAWIKVEGGGDEKALDVSYVLKGTLKRVMMQTGQVQ